MSAREFPSQDSKSRMERAEQVEIIDIREIDGSTFGIDATVYELDLLNEDGERRDNMVVIPRILFENTKDVQHRHDKGVIGKYSLALAQASDAAKEELLAGIDDKANEVSEQLRELRQKDSRLRNFKVDVDDL